LLHCSKSGLLIVSIKGAGCRRLNARRSGIDRLRYLVRHSRALRDQARKYRNAAAGRPDDPRLKAMAGE
jgi:hypothetical protein